MNKKGDVSDGLMLLIIVFFLAVSFLIVAFANSKMQQIVQTTVLNSSPASAQIISSMDMLTTTTIQRGFVMLFTFLAIGVLISSLFVRVHPAWFFMYIIFMAVMIVVAVPLINTYHALETNAVLDDIANQQTMTSWIMEHLITILICVVGLSLILLFAKPPIMADSPI